MKRILMPIDKKQFTVTIGGKEVVSLGGAFYCKKCGYKMLPEIKTEGTGKFQRAEFFIDTACLCENP